MKRPTPKPRTASAIMRVAARPVLSGAEGLISRVSFSSRAQAGSPPSALRKHSGVEASAGICLFLPAKASTPTLPLLYGVNWAMASSTLTTVPISASEPMSQRVCTSI